MSGSVARVEPRPSPLARSVRLYLDHLAVERGLAANSLAAYALQLASPAIKMTARDCPLLTIRTGSAVPWP